MDTPNIMDKLVDIMVVEQFKDEQRKLDKFLFEHDLTIESAFKNGYHIVRQNMNGQIQFLLCRVVDTLLI